MNLIGLAAISAILCGVAMSPVLLLWGGYCLTRRYRRNEGISILGFGILSMLVAGFLTGSRNSLGIFRRQAIMILADVFTAGGIAGKMFHVAVSFLRS